jgi:hypothetical protein
MGDIEDFADGLNMAGGGGGLRTDDPNHTLFQEPTHCSIGKRTKLPWLQITDVINFSFN